MALFVPVHLFNHLHASFSCIHLQVLCLNLSAEVTEHQDVACSYSAVLTLCAAGCDLYFCKPLTGP